MGNALTKRGLDHSVKSFKPEESAEYEKSAREWLESHSSWLNTNVKAMVSWGIPEGDEDVYEQVQHNRAHSIGFMFFFIALMGLGGCWAGRSDFESPFGGHITPACHGRVEEFNAQGWYSADSFNRGWGDHAGRGGFGDSAGQHWELVARERNLWPVLY